MPLQASTVAILVLLLVLATVPPPAGAAVHDLGVTIDGDTDLPTESLQLFARIDGSRARVLLDAVVRHDAKGGPQSEGTFKVELPTGASPYLLAFGDEKGGGGAAFVPYSPDDDLTVDAVMASRADFSVIRSARMAPRALAARAYTDLAVQQQVDPAILEGGDGSFSSRVFPLVPGTLHRIVLGYDVPVTHEAGAQRFRVHVPAPSDAKGEDGTAPQTQVDIISTGGFSLPDTPGSEYTVVSEGRDGRPIHVRLVPTAAVSSIARKANERELPVLLDLETGGSSFPLLDASPASWGTVGDVHHFAASVRVPDDIPTTETIKSTSHVVFAIETSFVTARQVGSLDRYIEIIEAVLKADADAIREFNVLLYDVGTQWFARDGWVANDDANRAELFDFLRSVLLEGATNLHLAVSEMTSPSFDAGGESVGAFDAFLLSSGSASWGETDPNRIVALLAAKAPGRVHTYHVGTSGGDPLVLRRLAKATGGTFTGGIDFGASVRNATATRYLRPKLAAKSFDVDGALDVVVSGSPATIQPGQVLNVAWRALSTNARTLNIETGGSVLSTSFGLPSETTDTAVRTYGIIANSILEEHLPLTEEKARAIALFYRVVGRTASLVMLETKGDYEEYGIPASHPFSSVRDINAAQVAQEVAEASYENARSARASVTDFVREIEATGTRLKFPEAWDAIISSLPESSLDIASKMSTTSFDRSNATTHSKELKAGAVPDATYDEWTNESNKRRDAGSPFAALRALTSLLSQQPGDFVLRRDVALSAVELGFPAAAYFAFKQVATVRPWEPQSYIQMASTSKASGMPDLAIVMFEMALAGEWPARFVAFDKVAAMSYARHLRQINTGLLTSHLAAFAEKREPEIRSWYGVETHAGVVVTMQWNQDATDVDLHVIEPSLEECYYGHNPTRSGGYLSGDATQGYGPEMYVQPNLELGQYDIDVNFYAVNQNRHSAPIKVLVEVFTDWGYSTEGYQSFTVVGRQANQRVDVTAVTLKEGNDRIKVAITADKPESWEGTGEEATWTDVLPGSPPEEDLDDLLGGEYFVSEASVLKTAWSSALVWAFFVLMLFTSLVR